jgi:4-amino-4-deoxy-L-arabinose transferase-like glycosyltransferase
VIALSLFLPALASLPVTDRDEARFIQSSRQMVQSGDPVDIRFQDQQRLKKPAGIYWLQASAALLSGQGDQAPLWVYRLPSIAGAVVSVLLLAAIGTALFGPSPALLASILFATGLVIGGEARIAKTDAMLLASTLSAMLVLARLYMADGTVRTPRRYAFVFWLSVAAAILIKGPIGPMVLALTIACLAVLRHPMHWLRPLVSWQAILVATFVALPWFLAITWQSSGAFWQGSVGADLMAKVVSGQEGKGAPPGSYLVAIWLTFWPASVLLILALPQIWQARQTKAVQFLLAWIIPTWLLFEAVPTKLLHYTLP